MSDAANTIAQKPAARNLSPARVRQFKEAEARVKASNAPTLELTKLLVPTDIQMQHIATRFPSVKVGEYDELFGAGLSLVRDQYETMAPILTFDGRHGTNFRALKLHLDRIVDGVIRSAYGAAQFYEGKRLAAKDATNSFSNEHRDEDRQGVDGGDNRAAEMRTVAAEKAGHAWSLAVVAAGACEAYRDLMGSDWQPYQANNRRSVSQRAASEEAAALGF
ncbi:hypothetical protein [Asaia krungthepensis]|uniref:Globin-sensor domain-containing protein n=1 Tax=Asaia krungthepensis NRIC 0535 TaxID=1307925 RepID=A0ABQ0Q4I9_9PROT|nr:hypothetical protein [Asaia krungthepensis]GBQ91128.1 hypothetical protein AA0535_2214 [Asaia krungthepensis NRIC 0535]